ncbi:hypothetical protein F7725_022587 [Dissostichus mawsoni]|uniref:Uncharacterized protein n=1 Tax=Dissostichus mawsoni TaxID=36200 RepID=A0A7J5YY77_DISMA|nr:hypothetical protein F7725_022587 [Dissostichus mawsoni]
MKVITVRVSSLRRVQGVERGGHLSSEGGVEKAALTTDLEDNSEGGEKQRCGPPCLPAWLFYYATLCVPHRCTAPESLLVNRCEQDWLAHRNTAAAEHPLLHPAMGQLAPLSQREVTSPSQRLSCTLDLSAVLTPSLWMFQSSQQQQTAATSHVLLRERACESRLLQDELKQFPQCILTAVSCFSLLLKRQQCR